MSLVEWRTAGPRDFLWNFAYSETDSESRHGDAWRERLGPALTRRLASGRPAAIQAADWSAIEAALHAVRGSFIPSLSAIGPDWSRARIPVSELGGLGVLHHPPFLALAPSGRLDEFVAALDAGRETPEDRFSGRYRRLRPNFEPSRMRGVPAVVGPSREGPFTEVDGLTRLSMLWSNHIGAGPGPDRIDLLVGTAKGVARWPFYGRPNPARVDP